MIKRSLTLLEVMIALALTAILFSVLFSHLGNISKANIKIMQLKEQVLTRSFVQQRLMKLFAQLAKKKKDNKTITSLFTTSIPESSDEALCLVLAPTPDADPLFAQGVETALYRSKKNELCLLTKGHGKTRTDILFEGATCLQFEFFDTESKTWVTSWSAEKRELPVMIKVKLSPTLEFAFFPPLATHPIVYETPKW